MALYPVTNAEWARFAAATGRESPQHWPGGVCPRHEATHPVVYGNWADAKAYAEWTGLQLLIEAQWEKAARVGTTTVVGWGGVLLLLSPWILNL